MLGPLFFFAIATVEGSLRPEYDAVAEPISALARGPRGWVQMTNFGLLGVSFFSFAVVLRKTFERGVAGAVAPAVFTLMTCGVLLAGAFVMDAPGAPPTLAGRIHGIAGFLVFPWIPIAAFLVAPRFRRDPRWRSYFTYTLVTGFYCLATLVFFLLFVGPPDAGPRAFPGIVGLVQRLILLPFFTWIALVARAAFHAPRNALSNSPLAAAR